MKSKLLFIMFFFCGVLTFAEVGGNVLGITDTQLNTIITEYLEGIFNRYLKTTGLRVTELSFTTNMYDQTAEKDKHLFHYNVQGRFRNFPINNRRLSGRLETTLIVRDNAGQVLLWGGKPGVNERDNRDLNITLLVDDHLSDELRDATVRNYITKNYEHPLDINVNRERVEIYPDKIFSYVTAIVNNDSIVYLRAIFEKQTSVPEKVNVFTIVETPWQLNRAETIFHERFPDLNSFRKDMSEDMFEPMRGFYLRTSGNKNINKNGSKIESITKAELKEANNGLIKLELNLVYMVDWWGFVGSYQKYIVPMSAYYHFNFETKVWEYRGIDDINTDNISAIK